MCQVTQLSVPSHFNKQVIKQILLICLWEGYSRICLHFWQIRTVRSQLDVTTSQDHVQLKYVLGPHKSLTTYFSPDQHGKMDQNMG